jgi:hypothetical protein
LAIALLPQFLLQAFLKCVPLGRMFPRKVWSSLQKFLSVLFIS